jgi:hypothetical protein
MVRSDGCWKHPPPLETESWKELPMTKPNLFYVYVLRDPRPGKDLQPFYVGKGQGGRAHLHWKKATTHKNLMLRRVLSKIRSVGLEPVVEILRHYEIETDAFAHEIELIAEYGRRNIRTGILCNLTDGGEGNTGGIGLRKRLASDPVFAEAFAKLSAERLSKLHTDPEFAKTHSERISKLNSDPDHKIKRVAGLRKKFSEDKEFAARQSEKCRERALKRNADPEFQAKAIAAQRAYWARRKAEKASQSALPSNPKC